MTIKALLDKIEKLEARIRDLEARPQYVPYPVYLHPVVPAPYPYVAPPTPWFVRTLPPTYTITGGNNGAIS
jgi:hypothetical protein